jgi:hypothetical protein
MNSPFNSLGTAGAAHGSVIDPHVATAVWAIVLAVACALVMIIAEIVRERNSGPTGAKRKRRKNPPS